MANVLLFYSVLVVPVILMKKENKKYSRVGKERETRNIEDDKRELLVKR